LTALLHEVLPRRSFVIDTCWPPEVAAIELKKVIDESTFFGRGRGGNTPFVGMAESETAFVFRRRAGHRKSLPMVRVVIEPMRHGGARIRVNIGVLGEAMAFLEARGLLGLATPFFAVVGALAAFGPEADRAEQKLRAIYASAPALPAPADAQGAYR
jgi:hypothetical protein